MKTRASKRTSKKLQRRPFLSLFDFFKPTHTLFDYFSTAKRSRLSRSLRVESLEARQLLTSYIVNTNVDNPAGLVGDTDGLISLREAITAANTNAAFGDAPAGAAAGDSITFNLGAGLNTITLGGVQLPISDDLSIDGDNTAGSGVNIIVSGNNLSRVFDINVNQTVSLSNLTATSGNSGGANGGAVLIQGGATVNLSSVSVSNSTAGIGFGGGMAATGGSILVISGGTISGNTAARGGGVHVSANSSATIDAATITGNTATGNAATDGGGGVYNENVLIVQNGALISTNIATGTSGSGGGVFSLGGSLTVSNSTITGNRANRAGGGIEVTAGSTSTLTNITLTNNNAGAAPATANPGNGGGLHITGNGVVTFNGGLVDGNFAAAEGGGLWNSSTGTLNLFDTAATSLTITNNVAQGNAPIGAGGVDTQGGGGVFNDGGTLNVDGSSASPVTKVLISNNQATGANNGSGGGILSIGGAVGITFADINNNETVRAGGGIEVITGTVTISSINLNGNDVSAAGAIAAASPGNGGGLHVTGAANVSITNSVINNNVAGNEGGGLWNSGTGNMTVTSTTVSGNAARGALADDGGGGVFNNGGTLVIQSGSVVSNNIAEGALGSGGGVFSLGGNLTVTNSTVTGNRANRAGGGIEVTAGSTSTLNNITLTNNNAGVAPAVASPGNGGGLHITGNGVVTVNGGLVTGNVAAAEGGGLWNSSTGTLNLFDTAATSLSITNNVAQGDAAIGVGGVDTQGGGGVFNDGGTLNVDGSIASPGTVVSINSNQATGATNGSGGGILSIGGAVGISFTNVNGNEAVRAGGGIEVIAGTVNISVSNLNNNDVSPGGALAASNPGNGGGLHVTGAASVNITSSVVAGNVAGSEGGGLWNSATGTMTVTSTTVTGNTASGPAADDGGGGVFNNGGTLTIQSGSFIGGNAANGTSGSGGGVFNNTGGTVAITNSRISQNTANRAGGGIEDNAGNLITIVDSTIDLNIAGSPAANPGNGGGIHITGAGEVSIDGSTINNNTATNEGGGIWNSATGTYTLTNSTISTNSVTAGPGGGVFNLAAGVINLDSVTITLNTASTTGGGIAGGTGGVTLRNTIVAQNTVGGSEQNLSGGPIGNTGFNLIGDPDNGTLTPASVTNIFDADAKLGPLVNNGGPTLTHRPFPGSPAIGFGNTTLTVDQRNVARPQGGEDDIGAVEVDLTGVQISAGLQAADGNPDVFRIINGPGPNEVTVFVNGVPTVFNRITTGQFLIFGSSDDDTLIVDNSLGLIGQQIVFFADGGRTTTIPPVPQGAGFDKLQLVGTTSADTIYNPGETNDAGAVLQVAGEFTQRVEFFGLEPVEVRATGAADTLIIAAAALGAGFPQALNADNAINYTAGPNTNDPFNPVFVGDQTGFITVDAYESLEFSNFGALVINAGAGSDEINLNNPTAPAALTGITVNGGDPTGSDKLVINGTTAANVVTFTPTSSSSGSLTGLSTPVNFATTENVVFHGQGGGDTLNVIGTAANDTLKFAPAEGTGSFTSSQSPSLSFQAVLNVSVTGGAGGVDVAELTGTAGNDVITTVANVISLAGAGSLTVGAGIDELSIFTLGGSDDVALINVTVPSVVDLGAGNDLARASVGAGVRLTLLGNAGDDALFGSLGADRLEGGEGDDVMVGGPGDDFAFGGAGSDTFVWNPGDADDLFEGDAGDDTLAFAGANGNDAYTISSDNGRVIFNRQPGNVGVNMGSVENIFANSETSGLSGRNEIPANNSTSTGFANFTYNAVTGLFDVRIFVLGLSQANLTDSHIHMGIAGSNGPVVVGFGGGALYTPVAGGLEFVQTGLSLANINPPAGFTAQQVLTEILLGRAYFNVHSTAFPGGEIRGNIIVSSPTAGSGGADSLIVGDLTGTSLKSIVFDAGNEAEIRNGAPLADTVTIAGLNTADDIAAGVPNVLDNNYLVSGLPYNILVTGSDGNVANGANRDLLTINGNGGNDTLTALFEVDDITRVTLNGGQGDDALFADGTLNGNDGNDLLTGGPGDNLLDGGAGDDTYLGNGGTDTLAAGTGADTILVPGTPGADNIVLTRSAANLLVTINGQLTTYVGFANADRIHVPGGAGDDSLAIDESGGLITLPITFEGGLGNDSLTLRGGTNITATYNVGTTVDAGNIVHATGDDTQIVFFTGLEPVLDTSAGTLTVNATNADNAINYSQGGSPANGLVSIDGFETIEFTAKTTLTINGLAGSDAINFNNVNTPTGLTGDCDATVPGNQSICVTGGDPTGSDTLIVTGTVGTDTVTIAPTSFDAATISGLGPTISADTIEHLRFEGRGGSDALTFTTPTGGHHNIYEPGPTSDSGAIISRAFTPGTSLLPVEFADLGVNGSLTFTDAGAVRGDTLELLGTPVDDLFTLNASNQLRIFSPDAITRRTPLIGTGGIVNLVLEGLAGDDTFNVPGNHPFAIFAIRGGDPSASDVLNFAGSGPAVTVDLAAQAVGQAGSDSISFTGIEVLNAAAGAGAITVLGRTIGEAIEVTPTGANTARIEPADLNLVVNTDNTGTLTVDTAGGSDLLTVNGTQSSETITVNGTLVTVNALKTVNYAGTEELEVFGQAGSDTFNVTPSATTSIFLDGGDPIGVLPGDHINIAGPVTINTGPENDEGSLETAGNQPVSFDHNESITVNGGGGGGGGGNVVNGTDGNDAITIIARDASTHAGANGVQDFTVSINDGPELLFIDTAAITVNALSGDDEITVRTPAPNDAVWNVQVIIDGGASTSGDNVILETPFTGAETATYTPTGLNSGLLNLTDNTSLITMLDIEDALYNGMQDGDSLTVTTPNAIITPGTFAGSGLIEPFDALSNPLLKLSYLNVTGSVSISGTAAVVQGTAGDDIISVSVAGVVTVSNSNNVVQNTFDASGFSNLVINALGGNDTINIPGNHSFDNITLLGGEPGAGSDVLNFTGSGAGAVTVNLGASTVQEAGFGAVSLSGVEILNANVATASATFIGTAGDDTIDVSPTGTDALTVRLTGSNPDVGSQPVVNFSSVGATMTVDGGVGSDGLVFNGTANSDTILLNRNVDTLQLNGGQVVTSVSNTAWTVNSMEGNDSVTVTDGNIATIIAITLDAGSGESDTLTNSTGFSTTYRPGTDRDAGFLVAGSLQIQFAGVDAVTVSYTAPATTGNIDAGPGANQITVTGTGATTVVTTVDNHSPVTFTGATLTTFNVNAGAGDDVISVTPGTFTGAGGINVNGGDPTGNDLLIVTATGGNDTIGYNPSNTIGSGQVTRTGAANVNFTTIESLVIDGQGGTDALTHTTPAGIHHVTYTPGSAPDSGTIATRGAGAGTTLVPLSFRQIGASGSVTFASGAAAREDVLELNGTNDSDVFNAGAASVQIVNPLGAFVTVTLNTGGIGSLQMRGLNGDDVFNVTGTLPYTAGTLIDAGDPSASDVVNLSGAAGAVTVDLGAQTVTGYGGTISFLGVEVLNANANANAMTVVGTANDDSLTVTVASANSGRVTNGVSLARLGEPTQTPLAPEINYTGITGALNVNLAGGDDRLAVVGNALAQTINVNASAAPFVLPGGYPATPASTVQVDDGGNLTIDGAVTYSGTEALQIGALEGNDTVQVVPGPIPVFVDGGDPIGNTAGDRIVLQPQGVFSIEPGPENDEGGLNTAGAQRVSWDHIEAITVGPPGPGGPNPALVLGTNGDDDITIIARDSSTHAGADGVQDFTVSVNDGPDILFLDTPILLVDALAGDDDIVVREPAPNNAVWNVQIFVAGGTPAAPTVDQGDVLELETPGTQTVVYSPNPAAIPVPALPVGTTLTPTIGGIDTAILSDTTNTSAISVAPFRLTVVVANVVVFDYVSSPGGVEDIIYQGLAGDDNLTINGTSADDTATVNPNNEGSGTHESDRAPSFSFTGATLVTVNGGTGGFDHVTVLGTEGPDTVTSTANVVSFAGAGSVTLGADLNRFDLLTFGSDDNVNLDLVYPGMQKVFDVGAGNDIVDLLGTDDATIFGGIGDDTLTGTPDPDLIYGGSGNDVLIGAGGDDIIFGEDGNDRFGEPAVRNTAANDPGNDQFHGGSGSDVFFWDPGDGDDLVEGGAGDSDQIFFSGNATAEQFFLFADVAAPSRFHLFRAQGSIDIDAADIEEVNLTALGGIDTITVGRSDLGVLSDLSTTTVRSVDVSLGADAAADNVFFNGRPLDDNLLVSVDTGSVKVAGLSYDLRLDGSDAALDRLTVQGNDGNDIITAQTPVEASILITLEGGAGEDFLSGDATLSGGADNDILIGGAGNNTITGGAGDDVIDGRGGTNTIDGGADTDTILVSGTAGPDAITTTHTAGTFTIAGGLSAGTNNITSMEAVLIEAGDGTDAITLNLLAAGGLNYTVLGGNPIGAPGDTLAINTPSDIVFTPGPENDAGSFVVATIASTNISFDEIESTSVAGVGAGVDATFNGTSGDDDITVQATSATAFTVAMGGAVTVSYSGLATFTVDAKEGDDDITVAPITPGGVALTTPITVIGNSPTAATGDQLLVEGSSAAETIAVALTATGGTVTVGTAAAITFNTTELLAISALGGVDTLNITGSSSYEYTPAVALDAGTIQTSTVPIAFTGLLGGETISVTGIGAADILIANGTLTNDVFNVAATTGNVVVNSRVTLSPTTIETLTLNGYDGDDTFNIAGPLPYTTTNIAAGDPSASDVANITGDGTAVTVTLAIIPVSTTDATVTGGGLGLINLSAVETANVGNGAGAITVTGEDRDDRMIVTPSNLNLPNTAQIQAYEHASDQLDNFTSPLKPSIYATTTGTLTVAGGAGTGDTLVYNGRTVGDDIDVTATTITHAGFKTITYDATSELLEVISGGGDDEVTLAGVTIPSTVDAGSGNDTVTGSATVTASMTIFGRDGDDTLTGGNVADTIYGGFGNDILIGGAGNDSQYGEEGQDIFGNLTLNSDGVANDPGNDFNFGGPGFDNFVWEPGDGFDSNNGGEDAADIFRVFGSAAGNVFDLRQGGTPTHLNVDIDGVVVDNHGIEDIVVSALGGADTLTVQDIYATEVVAINLNLGPADAAPDTVTINGRNVADEVSIVSAGAGTLDVNGLRYNVRLTSIGLADPDDFTFLANAGNDIVTTADDLSALFASSNVAANNHFTIDGGAGDDVLSTYGELLGGDGNDILTGFTSATLANFSQIIDGGSGNDQIRGGTGLDALTGGPGDDTFVPGYDLLNDTVDGGTGFDTILVEGGSFNDRIDVIQDSPTQLRYNLSGVNGGTGVIPGAGTETDVLASGTVEEVKVLAGSGDDQIRVTQSDSLISGNQQALSLRFTIDAGTPGASDRLTVVDEGLGDTTIQRVGAAPGAGSYQIGALAPVVYYDVEFTSLSSTGPNGVVPFNPIIGGYGTDGVGRLFVFKADPYESNNTLPNASFLGSGPAINVDPTIDPGFDLPFGAAGDEDWYRIVAETTGDLDVRVFFRQQGVLSNNRAGLPGNGNLDIALYDLDGIITGFPTGGAIGGVGTFGSNESTVTDSDERVRIPVVAGQTYYLRVRGAPAAGPLTNANGASASDSLAINVYNISVINTPAATPYGGEIDDIIAISAVTAAASSSQFSGGATLSALADFYNGKDIYFTSGVLNGQRGRIVDYDGGSKTFTFAPFTFTATPGVGDTFQVESFDTGRSQLDNITRDNTPIVRFRVDDAIYLQDVPGNPVPGNQLDPGQGIIPIPFSGNAAAQRETNSITGVNAGFRVAIFDEGAPQQPGQLPQVPVGYARQIAEGVYEFDFERDRIVAGASTPFTLTDGSHFLSARVQMVDPSNPNASGFGDRSLLLEIVVDTQVPPAFFGLPNVADDGLLPDSDTGVNANPETLTDRVTSDTTPGFFGQAEADAVIRLFIDFPVNPDGTGNGIFEPAIDFQVGFAVAQPFDGTNQYPVGYWQIDAINVNLNAAPFPRDGQRTLFLTAEDVAGNINPATGVIRLDVFIDTQGPQVTDVTINSTAELLGLTANNSLVRFNSDAPNIILSTTAVTGLGANTLQAIDILPGPRGLFRPGTLFGFATNAGGTLGQVYAILPSTGATTPVGGPFAINPSSGYDIDFNPTNNLLRIVDSANDNISFDIATGTATAQTPLNGIPDPDVVGAAYDRNDSDPSTPTTLWDIDFTADTLVRQGSVNGTPNSPGSGIITTIGALGVNTDANVGFDIARGTNIAYAALRVANSSGLYTVNLATGDADLVGVIGTGTTIVSLTALPAYDLFDPKPSTDGPTPPVNSLVISFRDLPARTAAFLIEALKLDVADTPGLYQVIGDHNGIIPIVQIIVNNQTPIAGQAALATVELVFRLPGPDGVFNTPDDIGAPLPDDRFTLTVLDNIIDLAGNHLDGESNASEPQEFPSFPSGDGIPGGNFVARFTIDSRPEIGNFSAGSAFIDINGNLLIDPQGINNDYTNRDLTFEIGTLSDALFAGKFEPAALDQNDNDGFDKLGAYGFDNVAKQYRFLLDFDHNGVSDLRIVSAFQINAIPISGDFAPNRPGDEIGLFDGETWYLDTNGDNVLDLELASDMQGNPLVGDFNGDGEDDLATYDAGKNKFFFDTDRDGQSDDSLQVAGPFNGYTDLPITGDFNLDGIDDLGIWVPNRQGSPTANISEWYFLISDRIGQTLPSNVFDPYAPTPLGNDVFAQFGDHFSLPLFGNFDPPVAGGSSDAEIHNSANALDVNADGSVSPIDALLIINQINSGSQPRPSAVSFMVGPYVDVNGDDVCAPADALAVINYLNSNPRDSEPAEGESIDAAFAEGEALSPAALEDDLLMFLAADSATARQRSLKSSG